MARSRSPCRLKIRKSGQRASVPLQPGLPSSSVPALWSASMLRRWLHTLPVPRRRRRLADCSGTRDGAAVALWWLIEALGVDPVVSWYLPARCVAALLRLQQQLLAECGCVALGWQRCVLLLMAGVQLWWLDPAFRGAVGAPPCLRVLRGTPCRPQPRPLCSGATARTPRQESSLAARRRRCWRARRGAGRWRRRSASSWWRRRRHASARTAPWTAASAAAV